MACDILDKEFNWAATAQNPILTVMLTVITTDMNEITGKPIITTVFGKGELSYHPPPMPPREMAFFSGNVNLSAETGASIGSTLVTIQSPPETVVVGSRPPLPYTVNIENTGRFEPGNCTTQKSLGQNRFSGVITGNFSPAPARASIFVTMTLIPSG